jgi:putative isomerase
VNKLLKDGTLQHYRETLKTEDKLMKGGIFVDPDTGRPYFTGYAYKTLYDWDQYFESIVQIYMGWGSTYIKNGVTIFLDHQQGNGMISRSVPSNEYHDPEHVKPFLAQIAVLVKEYFGETDWLLNDTYYPRLKKYIDFWLTDMDRNQNGLSEWMSAPHTGMDNQHERAGYWLAGTCEGVDLNCYLVRELRAMTVLAGAYGKSTDAVHYTTLADNLAARIREQMWDETDGIFYDVHRDTGKKIRVKYVGAFAPLWAQVASPAQAHQLVFNHLFNRDEFWAPYPVSTLSRSEKWYSQVPLPGDLGCSWRANTWIPTNYMTYHGLKFYGYGSLASLLAFETGRLMKKAGNREYYNAETGTGCGLDPFWGWSLLAHFMPYEEICNFNINAI